MEDKGFHRAGPAELLWDDVLLVATELCTNAVRACHTFLTVRVDGHRRWLMLSVSDDSPAPARRMHPSPEDTHGRGVDIVASLSSQWGQTPWDGRSKTVWSRLDFPVGVASQLDCDELDD